MSYGDGSNADESIGWEGEALAEPECAIKLSHDAL